MNIVFFGSGDFAVTVFKGLIGSRHAIAACVTQPDRPKGRHLKVEASGVKTEAVRHRLAVMEPAHLKSSDFIESLKGCNADLFVVVSYGHILPKEILLLPKIFCINIHPSLLPKYRGAAPINWAVINGDEKTGVSIIKMDLLMDAGEIISQMEVMIDKSDTSISLTEKLSVVSVGLLLKTLEAIENNTHTLTRQNPSQATLAPKLTKQHGLIHWHESAVKIHNLVRGLLPWPGAFTCCSGKLLKILETKALDVEPKDALPGEIIGISAREIVVMTGRGALGILRVHPESSREMDIKSFMAGHKLGIGFKFGQ